MNKEETNKTECETKEFDRSVCFSFFKSYLEQGEKVNKLYGAEAAYNYFIALIEYGLYQKEKTPLMQTRRKEPLLLKVRKTRE